MQDSRLPPPDFPTDAAADFAATSLEGPLAVQRLDSYLDANFLVTDGAGQRHVLKVAHASETLEDLQQQDRLLRHLAQALPGVAPIPVGEVREVEGRDGQRHAARLVGFVAGEQLGPQLDHADATTWRSLGTLLAKVDEALAGLPPPTEARDFRWDMRRGDWIVPATVRLWEPRRRALVQEAVARFLARLPRLEDLPQQWIHFDANESNVVLGTGQGAPEVVGLFDFGDILHAPRILELAVAGAYAAIARGDLPEDPVEEAWARLKRIAHMAQAYHAVLPLLPEELDLVFPLLTMRLAMSVSISGLDAGFAQDNPHITVSEAEAWHGLACLLPLAPGEVADFLRRAVDMDPRPTWEPRMSKEEILAARHAHTSSTLSISYAEPLTLVEGRGSWLFDDRERPYLDGVNNVCHVGHAHPHVVTAASRQLARLNTNTRYLHPHLARYVERLTGLFPSPLDVCFLVNSGSEANELALRLARKATGREPFVVLEGGYHGNTERLIGLSHYKFAGPGGDGPADGVMVAPCPDPYRGKHRGPDSGAAYAQEVTEAIARTQPAAFLFEPLVGCGGQVVPPAGFLTAACQSARDAGALCIADEVQVGFGRVGSHWWAHQLDDAAGGARPEIVTLGKPIGNGFPMAAVLTTPAVAEAFDGGMEFFNTFGGNPVACAVGLAVLDVIEEEDLLGNATRRGAQLLDGLQRLAEDHPVIGDARGAGLYLGAEFVRDREARTPDAERLDAVLQVCRRSGVLFSSDGPDHNVLKIKPPIVWTRAEADLSLAVLRRALEETA